MPRPTSTISWQKLNKLAACGHPASEPNAAPPANPRRSHLPVRSACGITLDLSRQSIDQAIFDELGNLAAEMKLEGHARKLIAGEAINQTEARPILHTRLRNSGASNGPEHNPAAHAGSGTGTGVEIQSAIQTELARMKSFVTEIRAGKGRARSIADRAYQDVVVIGIGGSALGPAMAVTALKRFHDGPPIHFISNIDGAAVADTLRPLDAATTLVVVISKTFTTEETNVNARAAAAWMNDALGGEAFGRQFVAVTANPQEATKQGYTSDNTFVFWNGVGGRYSMWSAVGLPIALAIGFDNFSQLLAGAAAMDDHFASAPFSENLPMLAAAVGIWNRNFLNIGVHAVLPYAERLARLPNHLQQLEMESNGKSVDLDGKPVDYQTCPVIFGEAGTNGQHSFYQLLHQGTDIISSDIIIINEREGVSSDQHHRLVAHAFAQASALWNGHAAADLAAHQVHRGGRPVALIELTRLDAFHLGALVAFYEHKVFSQGVLWHVNSFDQWGVELGKTIAREILPEIKKLHNQTPFVSQIREQSERSGAAS